MPRSIFSFIALAGLFCAAAGLWFGGLRNEIEINRTARQLSLPNEMPFYRCADSFYWISYARETMETGHFRVRYTQMDNAPFGRPNIGWASLNVWYLVVLAKIWSVATASPIQHALVSAALWASPILYLLSLVTLLVVGKLTRLFPSAAIAVLILGTAPRVYDDFAYAVPGHHGWHDLACLATLACLAAAILTANSRRWFIAAGLSASCAMWIGATQQVFGIAAAGAGALAGIGLARWHRKSESPGDPGFFPAEGWRYFGFAAAIGSLFFYALEYMPGPLEVRLEVNHPIYALAFLLGGEFLCRMQRCCLGLTSSRKSDYIGALVTGTALIALAAGIVLGPAAWHTMRQPFIQRLHREIGEFQPIVATQGWESIVTLGPPILLIALALWHGLATRSDARQRTALLACACPCAVAVALSFLQLRWGGIAGAAAAALAAVVISGVRRDSGKVESFSEMGWLGARLTLALPVFLSLAGIAFWDLRRNGDNFAEVRAEVLDRMATIEVANRLRDESRSSPAIAVFSDQKIRQAWIGYFTGLEAVGSLYWDSPDGIRDEAEFLGSYDEKSALQIARTRRIQYVVTTPAGGSVVAYHYMWQGNKGSPQIRQTLAYRLAAPNPTPPTWLQLLPTLTPAMAREGIRIYRVL